MSVHCLCGATFATVVTDTGGDTSRCVVYHCDNCGHDVALQLILRDLGGPGVPKVRSEPSAHITCGTNSGYQRHHKRSEHACQRCKDAHTRYWLDNIAKRQAS